MAKEDIILGEGTLYYAATGTANPDETTVAFGTAWGGSWTSLGNTLEPLSMTWNEDRKAIKTQQSMGKLKEYRRARDPRLTTVLAEHTGANLALVHDGTNTDTAAGASQKGFSQVTIGNETVVSTYKFGFESVRVDSTGTKHPVRYFFHIGSIGPDGDSTWDKENETGLPIAIEVYEDTSQSSGEEFMVIDYVTAAATA